MEKNPWISVNTAKPKTYNFLANSSFDVLVVTDLKSHYISSWSIARQEWIGVPKGEIVTHWMYIPPVRKD